MKKNRETIYIYTNERAKQVHIRIIRKKKKYECISNMEFLVCGEI
jgi:hypothetical protein